MLHGARGPTTTSGRDAAVRSPPAPNRGDDRARMNAGRAVNNKHTVLLTKEFGMRRVVGSGVQWS